MLQRYAFFFLFILGLNYSLGSCSGRNDGSESPADVNKKKMSNKIDVGSKAPGFSLPDQQGRMVSLGDFLGRSNVVLFFYPKDESYGCTREACSFRDNYEVFKEAGAEVIGISADDADSHKAFAANHRLPFILLSDKGRSVALKYGVGKSLGVISGRVTFVIDRQGVIRLVFSSQLNFQKHVDEAIRVLKGL
jgi:peroxiredoxin Q/BCP